MRVSWLAINSKHFPGVHISLQRVTAQTPTFKLTFLTGCELKNLAFEPATDEF